MSTHQYVFVDSEDDTMASNHGSTTSVQLAKPISGAVSVELMSFTAKNDFFNITAPHNQFFICYRSNSPLTQALDDLVGAVFTIDNTLKNGATTVASISNLNHANPWTVADMGGGGHLKYGIIVPFWVEPGMYTIPSLVEKMNVLINAGIFQGASSTGVEFVVDEGFRVSVHQEVVDIDNAGAYTVEAFLCSEQRNERDYRNSPLHRLGFKWKREVAALYEMFVSGVEDELWSQTLPFNNTFPLRATTVYHENRSHLMLTSDLVSGDVQQTRFSSVAHSSDMLQLIPIDAPLFSYIQFQSNGSNTMKHQLQTRRALDTFKLVLTDEHGKVFEDGQYHPFQVLLRFETIVDDGARAIRELQVQNQKRSFASRHMVR
jgi:hypothetical protein